MLFNRKLTPPGSMADVQWLVNKCGCGVIPANPVRRNERLPYIVDTFSPREIVYTVYPSKIKRATMKMVPRAMARLAGSNERRRHRLNRIRDSDWSAKENRRLNIPGI